MLQEAEDYNNKEIIIPLKKNSEYSVFTIKLGTQIFRGDEKKTLPSKEVPAFFSDVVSASIYTRGDHNKLSGFIVKKEPMLFQLSYENLINLFDNDERLEKEERLSLDKYLNVSHDSPPYIIPVDFLKKENSEGEHKLYLNRRILNIICRLGYDGWVALPDTLLQRNLDTNHYKKTGIISYKLNIYNPEIAICTWDLFLDPMK